MPATASVRLRAATARRALAGVALVVGLFAMAACSSPAPSQQELSDALVDSGLSRKVADCTASALTDSLTESELAEITERGAGGAPVDDPKVAGESADKLTKAMGTCRDLQAAATPSTTTTAPAGEGAAVSTTVAAPDGAQLNPASTTTTTTTP